MKNIGRFLLIFGFLLLFPQPALAVETAISVAPAILEAVTQVNEQNQTKITITNNTNFPLPIKGQASAFLLDTKLPDHQEATFNASSWFTLEPADFILQPLEKKEVVITILPPAGSEPGGHYATLYFQPLIPREVISTESTVSLSRVGVLTFLVVPGDINEDLSLASFSPKRWQAFGPLNLSFTLHNGGNVHVLPVGRLEINDYFGNLVATLPLPPHLILPGTNQEYALNWGKVLDLNKYTVKLIINYGSSKIELVSSNQPIFIIPWPLFLLVFVLLTLLYNIFIVHIDRLKLAIKVLKGHDLHETKNPQKNSRLNPRPRRRINPADSGSKGSRGRQSH